MNYHLTPDQCMCIGTDRAAPLGSQEDGLCLCYFLNNCRVLVIAGFSLLTETVFLNGIVVMVNTAEGNESCISFLMEHYYKASGSLKYLERHELFFFFLFKGSR